MNYKLVILFFSMLCFQSLKAQITPADQEELSVLMIALVNKLRVDKGKLPLARQEDLAKAAKLHADYIAKKGKLNHIQIGTSFPHPRDRVEHYNTSFTNVGENILYTKPVRSTANLNLKKLASEMFLSWKNSPGHYANMIADDFTLGDFGFTYNPQSKRVFAVQVFAKQGYIIEGQLSQNAFGIVSGDISCVDLIGNKSNIIVNVGNAVGINNGEVILKYHNVELLQELFENEKDGLAVDLVSREQLLCGEENRLDVSNIYDGVMLKPVYRNELFSSNIAENPNRLVVSLGEVPKNLVGESLSTNLIIIKEGKKCSYTVPANVPSRKYNLKPIEPEIYNPKIALKTEGVNNIYEVTFNFKSGKINPTNTPVINVDDNKIKYIDIKSFTSVDGNEDVNEKLHNGRAKYIWDFLNKRLNISTISINSEAKENWELCYYQLELLGLEEELGRDKENIKNYIKNNLDKNWEDALSKQRASKAVLYLDGSWNESDSNHLNYNLTDALLNKNYKLANKVLAEMYLKESSNLFLNEEFVIDKLFEEEELVQNVSALLLKNINYYDIDNVVFFVRNWLTKSDLLTIEAQKNLLNLYTITTRRLLRYWDSSSENLSKVLHPEKVEQLFDNYKNQDQVNPLFLNFHMSSIEYYGQINYNPKIDESFEFISNYFKTISKNVEDDTNLSLFFNNWSSYQLTIDNLKKRYDNNTLDEEATFVYAKTVAAYEIGYSTEDLLDLHKRVISFNKQRWCNWIDTDFQNLRNDGVKNLYCKTCKE